MVNFPISIFSQNRSERGIIKYHFFPKFKIVHIILGGGGQENYGLFPQFVTFSFWNAPLNLIFDSSIYKSKSVSVDLILHLCIQLFDLLIYLLIQLFICASMSLTYDHLIKFLSYWSNFWFVDLTFDLLIQILICWYNFWSVK